MSSKRRIRRNHCGDKQQFATREEARDAARAVHFRKDSKGKMMNVYLCLWATHYHYGHKPKTDIKKKVKVQKHRAQREKTQKVKARERAGIVEEQKVAPVPEVVGDIVIPEYREDMTKQEKDTRSQLIYLKKKQEFEQRSLDIDAKLQELVRRDPSVLNYQ
jgi:hypothetical protein